MFELGANNSYCLLTEVVDTGTGISKDKQKLLFEPFGELRLKDKIQDVENTSIGMGLTLSKEICEQLKGKVTLIESSKYFTAFMIKMPVQADNEVMELKEEEHLLTRNLEFFKKDIDLYRYL